MAAVGNPAAAVPAQRRVNTLTAEAKAAAGNVDEVTATFRGYSVQFIDEKPSLWLAQQSVEIKGSNSEALLDLVGRLQSAGLAIAPLEWRILADRPKQAHQEATFAALKPLREQATAAAEALGMEVDQIQSVTLDGGVRPVPMAREGMMAAAPMAAPMPPPTASPEEQTITSGVSADVVLRTAPIDRKPSP